MEYSENEPSTPCFGNYDDSRFIYEKLVGKKIPKSDNDVFQYLKKNDKCQHNKKEKKSQKKSKSKKKNKEKGKNKSSKSKAKKASLMSLPVEKNYENPFDIFLKKKIELRNDFDQKNSEKFLLEKEFAFQQFRINENADYLDD